MFNSCDPFTSPLGLHKAMDCAQSAPSEEFLGFSERGYLIDSLRGCFVTEALIDLRMHFVLGNLDKMV